MLRPCERCWSGKTFFYRHPEVGRRLECINCWNIQWLDKEEHDETEDRKVRRRVKALAR